MKKLILLWTLASTVMFFTGCMDNNQSTPPTVTVQPGDISSTGEPSTGTTAETTTGTTVLTTEQTTPSTSTSSTTPAKTITLADVANHKTESDCRTAINGKVYDVTAFFGKHPGGDRNILRTCGIDATQAFERQHGDSKKANDVLAGFEIGTLTQ